MVVQGVDEPEFLVEPDPGKAGADAKHEPNILDAVSKSNLIDSPGLIGTESSARTQPGQRTGPDAAQIGGIVVKTTASGVPVRIGDMRPCQPIREARIHRGNGKRQTAVLLNVYRQPDSNTVAVADEVHQELEGLRVPCPKRRDAEALLRSIGVGDGNRSRA